MRPTGRKLRARCRPAHPVARSKSVGAECREKHPNAEGASHRLIRRRQRTWRCPGRTIDNWGGGSMAVSTPKYLHVRAVVFALSMSGWFTACGAPAWADGKEPLRIAVI